MTKKMMGLLKETVGLGVASAGGAVIIGEVSNVPGLSAGSKASIAGLSGSLAFLNTGQQMKNMAGVMNMTNNAFSPRRARKRRR